MFAEVIFFCWIKFFKTNNKNQEKASFPIYTLSVSLCLSLSLSVSLCLSLCLSVSVSVSVSLALSVSLCLCLSLSLSLSVSVSLCLSVSLSLSVSVSLCLCLSLSLCLSVSVSKHKSQILNLTSFGDYKKLCYILFTTSIHCTAKYIRNCLFLRELRCINDIINFYALLRFNINVTFSYCLKDIYL